VFTSDSTVPTRKLTCNGRADSSSRTTVGPSGPSTAIATLIAVETAGRVAIEQADFQQAHQVRKCLRRRHVGRRRQIAQAQRPRRGDQRSQQLARAIERLDAALRFRIGG
jgi:glutathione S-transferase